MHYNSATQACITVLRSDMLLAFRQRRELVQPVMFFVLVVSLFPLGVGAEAETLQRIAPGVIWVAALLSVILTLDHLFRPSVDDGTLEHMLLSGHPLSLLLLAKIAAHCLVMGVPLLLVTPLLALWMFLPLPLLMTLLLTLILGLPILYNIGAIIVAVTAGLKQSGVFLALLVVPLYIPVLLLATLAIYSQIAGISPAGQLYMLAGISMLSIIFCPIATATALRISMS